MWHAKLESNPRGLGSIPTLRVLLRMRVLAGIAQNPSRIERLGSKLPRFFLSMGVYGTNEAVCFIFFVSFQGDGDELVAPISTPSVGY